jgi:hypothetical protein
MKLSFKKTCAAAWLAAASLTAGQAFAAGEMQGMAGDAMQTMGATHAPMHMTCKTAGMTKDGVRIEFRNTGKSEVPAGTKVHWRLRGSAQGDASIDEPVAPGGMTSQDYTMQDLSQMSAGAPCSVQMM